MLVSCSTSTAKSLEQCKKSREEGSGLHDCSVSPRTVGKISPPVSNNQEPCDTPQRHRELAVATQMTWGEKPCLRRSKVRLALGSVSFLFGLVLFVSIRLSRPSTNSSSSIQPIEPKEFYWMEAGEVGDTNVNAISFSLSPRGHVAVGEDWDLGDIGHTSTVRVFSSSAGQKQWDPVGPRLNGTVGGNGFGSFLSLSKNGTRLAVGERQGVEGGKVTVFQLDGDSWKLMGDPIIGSGPNFPTGRIVLSHDGERLAISNENPNMIKVYRFAAEHWIKFGEFNGSKVSMSSDGNRVVVGRDNPSEVQFYEYSGDSEKWDMLDTLAGKSETESFGFSLSLSGRGDRMAVGAPNGFNQRTKEGSGAVRVFEYDEEERTWKRLGGGDVFGEAGDSDFGRTVSLSYAGTRLAVAVHKGGMSQVRIYEYSATSDLWFQQGNGISGLVSTEHVSLSAAGDRVTVLSKNGEDISGRVRVFDLVRSDVRPTATFSDSKSNCCKDQMLFELILQLDEESHETSWILYEATNENAVVSSGGPYNQDDKKKTFIAKEYLPKGDCFNFVIYDDGNDGICCRYGKGNYTVSVDGEVVVSSDGRFSGRQSILVGDCGLRYLRLAPDTFEVPTFQIPTTFESFDTATCES